MPKISSIRDRKLSEFTKALQLKYTNFFLNLIDYFRYYLDFVCKILDETKPTLVEAVMNLRYSSLDSIFGMAAETIIQRSLEFALACNWDRQRQDELAARVVLEIRPDWSEIQALSAVDWVRSLSPSAAPV